MRLAPGHQIGRASLDRRHQLGDFGERLAVDFLRRRGARIVARNVRLSTGEVDVLAVLGADRVVVEVRTVTSRRLGTEAFDRRKADQVWSLARELGATRVDLVAVEVSETGVEIRWVPAIG